MPVPLNGVDVTTINIVTRTKGYGKPSASKGQFLSRSSTQTNHAFCRCRRPERRIFRRPSLTNHASRGRTSTVNP